MDPTPSQKPVSGALAHTTTPKQPSPFAHPELDVLMTVPEVCAYLRISRTTLFHQFQKTGVLPHYKIAGSVRFKLSDVRKLVASQIREQPS